MLLSGLLLGAAVASVRAASSSFPAGVIATGTQGVTNPPVATMPTTINQTSMARLLSINSIDDFCIFAPPSGPSVIGDTETIEVAWCTKPRNNARVIPDGVITGLSFLKTDFYVQIMGSGDFTKLNIQSGDEGGELDPHGATGAGNPVGGNVTTNIVDGVDEPIAEWMLYVDYNQFCIRACTNANSTYTAGFMCWHELDEMGCEFVMPGTYNAPGILCVAVSGLWSLDLRLSDDSSESCDADVAYPPGWYPTTVVDGTTSFSTFAQRFTGSFTGTDGVLSSYTVGDLSTPSGPFTTPSSSNCVTQATISNGIALASLTSGAIGTAPPTLSGTSAPQSAGPGPPLAKAAPQEDPRPRLAPRSMAPVSHTAAVGSMRGLCSSAWSLVSPRLRCSTDPVCSVVVSDFPSPI
ncbi:hypothetical protein B0H17DRAFT_1185523 [Mycena rosella]|uniref:Uncharacterized protein n=1 Tax=Mycena rosella TaxID=1033263 RepID=A0AAD7CQW6_MYCRO|nr:hypothetical protein B0H17DRAFT_1185523 [Mycena rosella]